MHTFQPELVGYLRSKTSKPPFSADWYKPNALFGDIFDFARQKFPKIRMLGICPEMSRNGDFSTTDAFMAGVIAQNLKKCDRMIVLAGDYHAAQPHLPKKVEEFSDEGNCVIVYQNSSTLYWDMRIKTGKCASAVQLSDNEYCVFNTSPLVKYQSALDSVYQDYAKFSPEEKVLKIIATIHHLLQSSDSDAKKLIDSA